MDSNRILKRPEYLKGRPYQARHVPSYHVDERTVRALAAYYEQRLTVMAATGERASALDLFVLDHLFYRMYDGWGTFAEFVDDFEQTQLGKLFKAWSARHKAAAAGEQPTVEALFAALEPVEGD